MSIICCYVFFSSIPLKIVLKPVIFFSFFIFTSLSRFSIESVFSKFQLSISWRESFWSLLVLLISSALISSFSDLFVSSESFLKWNCGIGCGLGFTSFLLFSVVSKNLLIIWFLDWKSFLEGYLCYKTIFCSIVVLDV